MKYFQLNFSFDNLESYKNNFNEEDTVIFANLFEITLLGYVKLIIRVIS